MEVVRRATDFKHNWHYIPVIRSWKWCLRRGNRNQGEPVINSLPIDRLARKVLLPAEWVEARAVLHRGIYLPTVLIAAVWLVVLVWAAVRDVWLLALVAALVLCLVLPAVLAWTWLRRRRTAVFLTNERVVAITGPVPVRMMAVSLRRLDQVHVMRPRWRLGRLASLAVVPFAGASGGDTDVKPFVVHDLAEADAFADKVLAVAGIRGN